MALQYKGEIPENGIVKRRTGPDHECAEVRVNWRIVDSAAPSTTLWEKANARYRYQLENFRGLNVPQIATLILDTGMDGIPGLRTVGANLVADYSAGVVLRGLPLPHDFGS